MKRREEQIQKCGLALTEGLGFRAVEYGSKEKIIQLISI